MLFLFWRFSIIFDVLNVINVAFGEGVRGFIGSWGEDNNGKDGCLKGIFLL